MVRMILAVIRGIIGAAPILTIVLTLLGSGLGSGLVVAGIKDFWFEHVSKPQIQRDAAAAQLEADTTAFEAEAAKAQRDREQVLKRLADQWSMTVLKDQAESDAEHDAQVADLLQEISDHEQENGDRTACGLTQRDLDFLNGGKLQPNKAAASGGR